jgi:alkylation response protein AidB-like acyl-CoA dehydrogenase
MTTPAFPRDPAARRAALLGVVEKMRDVLVAGAEEGERLRTLPPATVQALRDSGLLALKVPESLGGLEADPVTQLEVLEAVTRLDTSAGWCLMVATTAIGLPAGFLPDAAVATLLVDGRVPTAAVAIAPTGFATPVDGGYRLSGRWPFASGVRHAEWLTAGCWVRHDAQDPGVRHVAVFPAAAAEVHDNWSVAGLEGTGSNDFSVQDLFVPADFVWDLVAGRPRRGGALFRLGMPAFVAYEHVAFALGVARRALEASLDLAATKRRGLGARPESVSGRARYQGLLGESEIRLRAVRAGAIELFEEAWRVASAGQMPDRRLQAETRSMAVHATETAAEIVTGLFRAAGGGALYRSGVLQRCFRDLSAGAQHVMVADSAYERLGQILLGVPDVDPMG